MRRIAFVLLILLAGAALAHEDDWRPRWPQRGAERAPAVFDARGHYVGLLSAYNGHGGVFLQIDDALVFVPLANGPSGAPSGKASQLFWTSMYDVLYSTLGCSGPPMLTIDSGPRASVAVRAGSDVILYIAGNVDSKFIQTVSVLGDSGCGAYIPPRATPPKLPGVFYEPETTYPLTLHYPEPLTVRF